jgi:hypothetical protein
MMSKRVFDESARLRAARRPRLLELLALLLGWVLLAC